MYNNKSYRALVLGLLTLVYAFNFVDRQIVGILAPFIKAELGLTNTQIGLLTGLLFATFYATIAIPIAWMADRYNRVNIVSAALIVWSGFTALTGFAGSFLHIGLARMGVGIGEAGGSPPSHSIISDLYDKENRPKALAIYSMGIPFGIMFAYFATAMIAGETADNVPWRRIFIFLGCVGIGLAVLVRLVLREPIRGAMELEAMKSSHKALDANSPSLNKPPFLESLKVLTTIPSWWLMCFGIACGSFVSYSLSAFQTTYFFDLAPDFNFRTLMITLGLINGIAYAGGTFIGGALANKYGKKSVKAYGIIPAIAMLCALPCFFLGFWLQDPWMHLAMSALFLLFMGMYLGPCFSVAQSLAPIHMRAMSTALFFFILNMISLGGGPTIAGILIDHFDKTHETIQAIRIAFSIIALLLLLSTAFFLRAAKTLPKDWADAQARNEGIAEQH